MAARVLVLEDSPTQAEALRYILETAGFAVATAADGRRGLELHREGVFEVVISDVLMPGLTGYEFCRAAKSDPRLREVPVVLLTSLSEPMDIVEGLQCGADNFITKPYEPDALVDRLRTILARRRERQERRARDQDDRRSVELDFMGHRVSLSPENEQIFDLLLASFEQIARTNRELEAQRAELGKRADELVRLNADLARARDHAERESRFKSRFLASMSHELRTPLNSIIGFSELLAQELPGPLGPRQRDYIDNVLGSGRHLLNLVNEILDLSKIAAGKLELRREWTPLLPIVEAVIASLRPLAEKQELTLEVRLPDDLPELDVDRVRLKEVLYNLLSNAIKFTRPDGKVTLRARASAPAQVEIAVSDTGIGIAAEDLPRLFREFEQIESGELKPQGTGLGLALCKRLVELHGGDIKVTSQLGQGSTFSVFLPAKAQAGEEWPRS